MDLEQLQKEAEKDLKINNEQLDIESLKTPELYAKYLILKTILNTSIFLRHKYCNLLSL